MTCERIYLDKNDDTVTLDCCVAELSREMDLTKRPAMLVLPGGGYHMRSDREAEPIARQYYAAGFNTFVLRYSINDLARFPRPLAQASLAIKYIRDNAEKLNIDPKRVFAVGFSAGGHLAACLASMWKDEELARFCGSMPYGINRPDGVILSYAVTAFSASREDEFLFDEVTVGIGGKCVTDEEKLRWSPADHVDSDSAPAFFWHTSDDPVVPVKNALYMAAKYAENGIKFESHIYPHGPHGMALCNHETESGNPEYLNPRIAQWIKLSVEWIETLL
ncbi:MAG: alpha/beta hydrolase [Eubacteriales bacterium]